MVSFGVWVFFYVKWTKIRVIWEEGPSVEERLPLDWLIIGTSVEAFSSLMVDTGRPSPLWVASPLGR